MLWYKTNCGIPGVCFGTRLTVVYLVVLWYETNCGIPGVCFGTRLTVVYLVCALVRD